MTRAVIHHLLTSALAVVVIVVNGAPQSIGSCASQPTARKCCGCCKSHGAQSHGAEPKSCCAKRVAQTAGAAKPHCCCSKSPARPAAPVPTDLQELVKQTLLATQFDAMSSGSTVCDTSKTLERRGAEDITAPPARVLFSVWLI